MTNPSIICIGDPIQDIYVEGVLADYSSKRLLQTGVLTLDLKTSKVVKRDGGALNVLRNIEALLPNGDVQFLYPIGDLMGGIELLTIVRTPVHTNGFALTSSERKEKFYQNQRIIHDMPQEAKILVLADYNKGTLNRFAAPHDIDKWFKCAVSIVDSRYRSLDMRWLPKNSLKIWHATGDEWDIGYAENFDWVFHTNGNKPVRLIWIKNNKFIIVEKTLPVPNTKVVSTCGAGDTFTASIACFLNKETDAGYSINKETLIRAGEFAIKACQDVITQKYTSTTRIKLE
jgi:bifunctional ADP-heptose synthase (sugar kinase/adenylyltransferase)